MAAPSTVYKDYMTRRRKGGTTPVDIDLYIAKFLQNTTAQSGDTWGDGYFNSTDTEAQKIAKIKDIFKIDGFLCVPKGTTENGFIGFCYSRNSGNGLYHKTERFSGVRVPTTVNASAELLNDGGLNCMGTTEASATLPNVIDDIVNNDLKISGTIRGSFYEGISWGIMIKCIGALNPSNPAYYTESVFTTIGEGTLAPKIKQVLSEYAKDVGAYILVAPNRYEIKLYVTNAEGTQTANMSTTTISPFSLTLKFSNTSLTEAAAIGGAGTYYKNSNGLNDYTCLFTNAGASVAAAEGYYVTPKGVGRYADYYIVDATGHITGMGLASEGSGFDYNTIRTPVDYYAFKASSVTSSANLQLAYDIAVQNEWTVAGTIYQSDDGTYYVAQYGNNTLVTNGYYMLAYGPTLAYAGWMRTYSGIDVENSAG